MQLRANIKLAVSSFHSLCRHVCGQGWRGKEIEELLILLLIYIIETESQIQLVFDLEPKLYHPLRRRGGIGEFLSVVMANTRHFEANLWTVTRLIPVCMFFLEDKQQVASCITSVNGR